MSKLKVTLESVTPAMAKEFLKSNHPDSNRHYRERYATDLSKEMKRDEWEPDTGEPIQFDVNGRLRNGQHRLNGQIMADKTYNYVIVRNVPVEAFSKMDIGLKRTAADVIGMEGASSALRTAGMIRRYKLNKRGIFGITGGLQHKGVTNTEILKEYQKRKRFWENLTEQCVKWVNKDFLNHAIPISDLGGFYAYLHDVSPEDASKFFAKLATGAELGPKSPILQLRNYLFRQKEKPLRAKINVHARSGMIMKSWNLFRSKKTIDKLIFIVGKEEIAKPA
jgi:hypothetical protein